MDCRRTMWVGLALLGGAAGCAHQSPSLPLVPPAGPQAKAPPQADKALVKKEQKLPPKQPSAATCIAAGDFYVGEAAMRETEPAKQEGLREQARKAYQQALTLDPKNVPAQRGLAALHLSHGSPDRAAEVLARALEQQPKNAALWFDLGMVHSRRKDWPHALESLARASGLEPDNRQFESMYGYALARAGRYDDSLKCFARLESEAKAHYNLARMLQHMQQGDLCRYHARLALQKDPSLSGAAELLARLDAPPTEGAAARPVQPVVFTDAQGLPVDPEPEPRR